jgi:hypothetical protein
VKTFIRLEPACREKLFHLFLLLRLRRLVEKALEEVAHGPEGHVARPVVDLQKIFSS